MLKKSIFAADAEKRNMLMEGSLYKLSKKQLNDYYSYDEENILFHRLKQFVLIDYLDNKY